MTPEELRQFLFKKQTAENSEEFISQLLFELSNVEKDSNRAIKNIKLPEVQKVEIAGAEMVAIKGEKGDPGNDGYTPIKFKDYFNTEEINKIVEFIERRIRIPQDGKNGADGYTPIAGKDYPSTELICKFIEKQIGMFPIPKDGKDGKDGKDANFPNHEWNSDKTQIRFENPDGSWGEWSAPLKAKDGRFFSFGRKYGGLFTELFDVPNSYIGQSGKILKVKTTEDGLEFGTGGGGTGAVDSVNGQIGDVILDPDDLDDAATTHKFTTDGDISKLAGIEAGANNYSLPTASDSVKGGIKVGARLSIASGVLSADVQGGGGGGDVIGPAANNDEYIPQWNGPNSKTLKNGLAVPAGGLAGLTALGGKEDASNKRTSFQVTPDDTHYPSEKLVKDSLDGKQPTGSYLVAADITGKEDSSNKSTDIAADAASNTKYPGVKAIKDYADGLVAGLLDYRGGYDASGNAFPTTGGSGTAGAIMKGDTWVISVAGTLGGAAVQIGDSIIANVDTPGQTASKWNSLNTNLSYVPQDVANLVTTLSGESTDTQYPSAKLTYDQLALKVDKVSGKGLSANDFTDALKTKVDGVEASADVTDAGNVATAINGAGAETTIADASKIAIIVSSVLKTLSWAYVKSILKTYFDGIYATGTIPVKATKAEMAAGTDDAKFLTALAAAELHQLPEGTMWNGKIVVSVASNNLTVALKTKAGTDPSATDPVYVMINGTLRTITAALSVTKNAATNWFNAGGAELATKEIDFFVYLGYNATNGVVIGFARFSGACSYDDFSTTTTNEKYCAISDISNAVATDYYNVIGRFPATLSAGAGYTWTIPTFTAKNLIQKPIYKSRWLNYNPQITIVGGGNAPTYTEAFQNRYQVDFNTVYLQSCWSNAAGGTPGTGAGNTKVTLPFADINFVQYRSVLGVGCYYETGVGANFLMAGDTAENAMLFLKGAGSLSGTDQDQASRYIVFQGNYNI